METSARLQSQQARLQLPIFSEEALALRFAEAHANKLRYVAEWGKWFHWTGNRWEEEKTRYVFDLANRFAAMLLRFATSSERKSLWPVPKRAQR